MQNNKDIKRQLNNIIKLQSSFNIDDLLEKGFPVFLIKQQKNYLEKQRKELELLLGDTVNEVVTKPKKFKRFRNNPNRKK